MAPVEKHHELVPEGLGQDGRGRDGRNGQVAADDRFLVGRVAQAGEQARRDGLVAVHAHKRRYGGQMGHGPGHGGKGRLQNIDAVDLGWPGHTHGPGQGLGLDGRGQLFPAGRGELFGIREPGQGVGFG
jgi:hypothetical protein